MKIMIVILIFFLESVSFAEEPTFDFKGIKLGSDISSIENNSKFTCRDSNLLGADRVCTLKHRERETVANTAVKTITLLYYSGKLECISILIEEKNFTEVVEALMEKYGKGTLKSEMLQNRMGSTFENQVYSWRRGNSNLEAIRYFGNIEKAHLKYFTDFSIKEFARRRDITTKEKAKDL